MKSPYDVIGGKVELSCKKNIFCERTADYMAALADAEYEIRRIAKHSHEIVKIKDKEIGILRAAVQKKFEETFKEIHKTIEIERLKNQVNELLEFKKHYEGILQDVERELLIDNEIESEMKEMTIGQRPIPDVDSFITKTLFLTKEEYEQMSSE
jgi:hypothetical protein